MHLECVPRKDDCSTNTTIPKQTCVLSNMNAAKEQHCTQSEPEPASESLEELLPLLEEGAGPAPASISAAAGSSRATRGKPRGCNNNIPQLSKQQSINRQTGTATATCYCALRCRAEPGGGLTSCLTTIAHTSGQPSELASDPVSKSSRREQCASAME